MYGYIYRTINLANGMIYIGKKTASKFDPTYLGSGDRLGRAIGKYGLRNFFVEFLIPCFSKEELELEEQFLIDWFNARDRSVGYNIAEGGTGGDTVSKLEPEHYSNYVRKISEQMSGRIKIHKDSIEKLVNSDEVSSYLIQGYELGRSHEAKSNCSKGARFAGLNIDDSIKQKMSEAKRGKYTGPSNSMYGKHHSPESRKLISENHADVSGENNPCYGRICITNGILNKKVKPEELDNWINSGWRLGVTVRRRRITDEHKIQ